MGQGERQWRSDPGVVTWDIMEISHPIFHDIIKSIIQFECEDVFEICKTLPETKDSRIFKSGYWEFKESHQEHIIETQRTPFAKADGVWIFRTRQNVYPSNQEYRIIHEVKTGKYDLTKVYAKAYAWQGSQLWIWGWPTRHLQNMPNATFSKNIRQINISALEPIYTRLLTRFIEQSKI